jgi:cytochrome-b5 reductase
VHSLVRTKEFSRTGCDIMLPLLIAAGLAALLILLIFSRPRSFLSAETYKAAELIEKQTITHNTKRFRFALPAGRKLGLPIGQHISFAFNDADGKQVMRSYTPVTGDETMGYVDFVIKVYPQGKMSQHVDSLSIHDTILMKGPKGKFKYTANMKSAIGKPQPSCSIISFIISLSCCLKFVF